jgi:tetratricopeptide (TPR) repeat protein
MPFQPKQHDRLAVIFRAAFLAGSLFFIGHGLAAAQAIGQTSISEESISGPGSADSGLVLAPESAQRLLARGAPSLALRLANQVLDRGGAPLVVARWIEVKIGALIALDRQTQAISLLEGVGPNIFESQPNLWLLMAEGYLAEKNFEKARDSYSKFMLRYPDHLKRFVAQRGMGLIALAAGAVDEAELLLNLYAQDGERPNPDPLLIIALGQLSHLKGDADGEGLYLTMLADLTLPDAAPYHRQRIEALALWHIRGGRWQKAFSLVENGLQTHPSPGFRRFHQGLLNKWLQVYHPKKKQVDSSLPAVIQRLMRDGSPLEKREAALDALLERESNNPIGLFQEAGALASELFLPQPPDPQLRMLLAKAHISLQNGGQAWELLSGLGATRAQQLRLRLLAAGLQPDHVDVLAELRKPLSMEGEMVKEAVAAMFAFTKRREVVAAAQLRRMLSPLSKSVPVRRALRYQQAMDRVFEGEKNSALTLYLELIGDSGKEGGSAEYNTLLPMDPAQAAGKILEDQGAFLEAAELRKMR